MGYQVGIYISAICSSGNTNMLLEIIDNIPVIEHTYNKTKWNQFSSRLDIITNSPQIASIIGPEAYLIKKQYKNEIEFICEKLFANDKDYNPQDNIIVIVQANQPFLDPAHIDFAIQKFIEHAQDPFLAAVFLHCRISSEQAQSPNKVKITVDENNHILHTQRSVISNQNDSDHLGLIGISVYRKDVLQKLWKHQNNNSTTSQKSDWEKVLEMGYTIKSFETPNPAETEVYTQQDLNFLSKKYSKPRIYLIRSGGFAPFFVEKTNTLWPLRENDIVARFKNTTGNNLDIFEKKIDFCFFRLHPEHIDPISLKANKFTAQPSDKSVAIVCQSQVYGYRHHGLNLLAKFAQANNFKHVERINKKLLLIDFTKIGALYKRGQKPSLGLAALFYFHHHFPDHLIVLIDFTFQGLSCHIWEKEKEYAKELEKENHVIRLLET